MEKDRTPLFCISGNNDVPQSLKVLEDRGYLIDYQERYIGDTKVVGMGYAEQEAVFNPDLRDSLLLTHLPPRRRSVPPDVTNVPRFHFAGHYHSRESIWRLNKTFVVQVPTAMNFRAATLRLPKGWIEFIDLE
jgi:Icc-related predicted phosphoesterase